MSLNSTMLLLGKMYISLTRSSPMGISSSQTGRWPNDLLLLISLLSIKIFTFLFPFFWLFSSSLFDDRNPFSWKLFCIRTHWQGFLFGGFKLSMGTLIDFLLYMLLSFVERNDNTRVRYERPSCKISPTLINSYYVCKMLQVLHCK